jgi:hypothetical protein
MNHAELTKASKEVVAFYIDGHITNNLNGLTERIKYSKDLRCVTRAVAAMMGNFDLGIQWEQLANAPVLFRLDENNKPVFIEGGLLKAKEVAG